MSRQFDKTTVRYAIAVGTVALAIGGELLLQKVFGRPFPLTMIFLAVLAATCYAGTGPALMAAALGAIGSNLFLMRRRGALTLLIRINYRGAP
jgi:K+-sensing histidine kinase KdpD